MDFLTLCKRTREKCGISGNGPLSVVNQAGEMLRIVNWVNESWVEIQNKEPDWMWMREDFSFQTQNGKQAYTKAEANLSDLAYWRLDTLRIYRTAVGVNDEQWLHHRQYESFRDVYQYSNRIPGRPSFFTVRPNDHALLLGPIPQTDIFTVVGEYQKRATELVANADIPAMPEQFHMLIVYGAMERYASFEAAPEVMVAVQREYGELKSKLELHQLERNYLPETLA